MFNIFHVSTSVGTTNSISNCPSKGPFFEF